MIEPQAQKELPPWTEDVWDRWFYSFMKEVTASNEEEGPGLEVTAEWDKKGRAE